MEDRSEGGVTGRASAGLNAIERRRLLAGAAAAVALPAVSWIGAAPAYAQNGSLCDPQSQTASILFQPESPFGGDGCGYAIGPTLQCITYPFEVQGQELSQISVFDFSGSTVAVAPTGRTVLEVVQNDDGWVCEFATVATGGMAGFSRVETLTITCVPAGCTLP